jgi:integrase
MDFRIQKFNANANQSWRRLKRYVRPALRLLGIKIGGWHDFRDTLGTTLRKHGWSANVRADILGHSSLQVTDGVYDHSDQADFREALGTIASELL